MACGDDGGGGSDAGSDANVDSATDAAADAAADAVADAVVDAVADAVADAATPVTTFVNPPEWEPDADGVYQLRMEVAAVEVGEQRLCLRTWNGSSPGPTLRIPAAAAAEQRQIRVDFENTLTTEDQQAVGPPGPGAVTYDFNQTNLHTHGLHVQPENATGTSFLGDNVLVHHAAGATAQYRYDIDEDLALRGRHHEPGTFWYHPHVHGTTGIHVANGMAGAIIVEGDFDALPGLAEAEERIFVMTHIPVATATELAAGEACTEDRLSVNSFMNIAGAPTQVQVNGVVEPRIVVPPGQVEHWRLIHAGITQEMELQLVRSTDDSCSGITGDPITTQQIAQDGITLHAKVEREAVYLAGGNRVDIMVEAPAEEGTYCFMYSQAGGPPGSPTTDMIVAILEVDASAGVATGAMPSDSDLDSVALPLLDCAAAVDGNQSLTFSQQLDPVTGEACEGGPPGGLLFNIDCRSFDPTDPRVLSVNDTEEWAVSSESGSHPLHIHINPFMVCEGTINGEVQAPHWRDTMLIEQANPATLRMFYENFSGSFVTHCHKLHHEDQGMMEVIRIDP